MIHFNSRRYFRRPQRRGGLSLLGAILAAALTGSIVAVGALASTATTNLAMSKPTVGADTNNWGALINADLDALDALWVNIGNVAFGTAATKNTGTSGATVPLLNGTNTWAAAQTFSGGLSGTLTGNVTGNLTGNVTGALTGTASNASTVTDGVITPAKLALTARPSWDSANFYPIGFSTGNYFTIDAGNSHLRLYFSATDFIEFDKDNHQVKFILSGSQVGHVDPVSGFVSP